MYSFRFFVCLFVCCFLRPEVWHCGPLFVFFPKYNTLGLRPWLFLLFFRLCWKRGLRVEICHSIQDQFWKLEVRRLLQWASNGRIMQPRSSGCPHYPAAVVINGRKCMLSKSEEKCFSSSEIQMVPLQLLLLLLLQWKYVYAIYYVWCSDSIHEVNTAACF